MQYVSSENLRILIMSAKVIHYCSIKMMKFSLNLIRLNFKSNYLRFGFIIYTFAYGFPGISSKLYLVSAARDASYVYLQQHGQYLVFCLIF